MIGVYIIDDSALVRQVLSELVAAAPDMSLLGAAPDPVAARAALEKAWPDVILLDLEMPRQDGLSFLRQLMAERPTPVVVFAAGTEQGSARCLEALAAGAIEVMAKPALGVRDFLRNSQQTLWTSLRAAAAAAPRRSMPAPAPEPKPALAPARPRTQLIAIGASTGGVQALEFLLTALRPDSPPLAIVQHMPAAYTGAFARRLNELCPLSVKEAETGDSLVPGLALIAPGGRHLELDAGPLGWVARLTEAPPVNRHCPSVDVLFHALARHASRNLTGVLLTGMGEDGARGLLSLRRAGARTIAQDESSSVVFGMPRAAIALGGADIVAKLEQIPSMLEW